ncbi:hypothetical protein N7470_006432 [Penicillium chermesinum]|nr:hypothetical protein N7470_006432 [Penicillium chermesinum]
MNDEMAHEQAVRTFDQIEKSLGNLRLDAIVYVPLLGKIGAELRTIYERQRMVEVIRSFRNQGFAVADEVEQDLRIRWLVLDAQGHVPLNFSWKRRQYSSCEACRKSRLGCDAQRADGPSCSNCARRGKRCVVKWAKEGPKKAASTKGAVVKTPASPASLLSNPIQPANRHQEGRVLHGLLYQVFVNVYEARISDFLESHTSPALSTASPSGKSILAFMVGLDNPDIDCSRKGVGFIHQTTNAAIRAFSLKYLLADKTRPGQGCHYTTIQQESCFKSIWAQGIQAARDAMESQTYQSALTLYIIGLASMSRPTSHKPANFERTCFRAASDHISKLRPYTEHANLGDYGKLGHNVAYLCAALSDNAFQFSLSRGSREPTLFRMNEQIWTNVRDRTHLFHQSFEVIHGMHDPMSKKVLSTVLQHATMFKSMMWWNFHHTDHDRIDLMIHDAVLFNRVYAPLLDMVARDFLLIHPREQLSFVLVTTHFHWAILLLLEEVKELGIAMPVGQSLSELASVRSIVNALNLAQLVNRINAAHPAVLLLDPMPETLTDIMYTTAGSLIRLCGEGQLSLGATQTMLSVIVSALEVIQGVSLKANGALEKIRRDIRNLSIFVREAAHSGLY